ncbi:MAG: tRNA pseudouridine(55) synthase TruB [Peptococcaceae bacterium]|nr:tRNA pseudouridine(55) synthase TruB [Peptococcaceae bacterium]
MNGIVNVLKPPGMSSHDVVAYIRRTFKIKKAGHAGTLDPGAAGVLVVCLGAATRLAQFLLNDDKEYRAEITFGLATSSGDSYGAVTFRGDASHLTEDVVRSVLPRFRGEISQVPPMTSALKRQGKKLYELARSGLVVDRPARAVNIYSLELVRGTGWGGPYPRALLHLSCSKGTYVRSLCEDIGNYLGCGAHMSFLVRTRSGAFHIAASLTLEELAAAAGEGSLAGKVTGMDEALSHLPAVLVKSGAAPAVASGSKLYLPGVARLPAGLAEGSRVRLVGPGGLLAVAETAVDREGRYIFRPICVLANQPSGANIQ